MGIVFALVHSPSVGPSTWQPAAARLVERGQQVVVPSLLHLTDGGPPYWPRVVEKVNAALRQVEPDGRVVVVAHSNAGLFVPMIVGGACRRVAGCLFVDASLPARSGSSPVAPAEFLPFLRDKASGGELPPWTDWWDEADVAPMFPDPQTRARVSAEQPRLPLSYYEQAIPVPDGWDDRPCGYLLFGPPYDQVAQDARDRGWLVEQLPGLHLHQLVDPDGVGDRLIRMTNSLGLAAR